MKKIKKLGKIAFAGLVAGATITGASANLSDYPKPFMEDGAVNTQIVVGDNAKTADVVSAINIAGSLGNSAFKSMSVTSSSVDGESYETGIRSALSQGLIDASDYSNLARETVTDVNDTEHFVVEKIGVSNTVDTKVNKTDVLTTFATGALEYTITYTPGFNPGAEIPVLGENYEITSIDSSGSPATVELGSTMEQTDLAVGDSYDHGPYTVEVTDADKNNNEVFVRVSEDETVLKSSALSQGESFTADEGALEVSADQIFFGNEDHITLSSTWTNTEVADGEESPFDENYDASLSFSSGQLTGITLTNNVAAVQNPADDSGNIPALKQGESFAGPQDYFRFTYQGLSSEDTEEVKVSDNYEVSFQDTLGFSHSFDVSKLASGGDTTLTTTNPFTSGDQVGFVDGGTTAWESGSDLIAQDIHNGGTVSVSADTVVAGQTPSDGATGAQYTQSGFDADWSLDSIDVSNGGAWDSGSDAIVIDVGDRSTFGGPDIVINDEGTADRTDGDALVSAGASARFYDQGTAGYDNGDEVYQDDDGDNLYTGTTDTLYDGDGSSGTGGGATEGTTSATNGAALVDIETVYGAGNGLYYVDSGGTAGAWDPGEDIILDPNTNTQSTKAIDIGSGGNDPDGDTATDDDIVIYTGGDGQQAADSNTADPFQAADDGLLAFNDGEVAANSDYDDGEDIFQESHEGDTYSASTDTVISRGSDTTVDMTDGAASTNNDFADSTYYVVDQDGGGLTTGTDDDIVTDPDGDSAYTAQMDTVVAGQTLANGTSITSANAQDADWSIDAIDAADDGGAWSSGADTLHEDEDADNVYTAQGDTHIAGITLSSAGAGTSLTTTNPFSDVAFQDGNSDSTWQSSNDLIAQDDGDNNYESGTDTVIAGTAPGGIVQNGDSSKTVYTDVNGRPLKIEWDDTADEATITYQSFSKPVSVGDSQETVDTGYGFSLTTSFTGSSGSENLAVGSSDSVLNTRFGSQIRYQATGVDSTNPDVQIDENGDGFNFGDSDGVDVAVSYDGSGNVDRVTTDDGVVDATSENVERRTSFGTALSVASGMDSVSFELPENQLNALHALGELEESSTGRLSPTGFPEAGLLASEADKSENMILVGGPKVNSLVKELASAGKTWNANKYRNNQGVGLVDYIEDAFNSSATALVVSGWNAQDTTAAADFLADYEANADRLKGERLKINSDTGKVVK